MAQSPGTLFVVSAPSGAGKTTLVSRVLNDLSENYPVQRVVTYTSRPPRPNEQEGRDYHFITPDEFHTKILEGFFLESVTYSDRLYASPASVLDDVARGNSRILIVDLQGAQDIAQKVQDAVFIWIAPPDLATLQERLEKRGDVSPEQLNQRLFLAEKEIEQQKRCDFFNHVIVNDDLATATQKLKDVVLFYIAPKSA